MVFALPDVEGMVKPLWAPRPNRLPVRACLREGAGPQVGEITYGGLPHLTCKRDHIKMRDCIDRRVTPPKRVTSPTWGPPPPRKQALRYKAREEHHCRD